MQLRVLLSLPESSTLQAVETEVGKVTATAAFGRWEHQTADGKVACDLCPRACLLRDGQRGFCFVRQRQGSRIVLVGYGRASGFCVDPIEKKPLNHFYPGSSVLSFGGVGCNLACKFCQNWNISRARSMEAIGVSAMPSAIAAKAVEMGCRSVAFTYNDPVIFAEYAIDTAVECRARDVATVAVTAGYIGKAARADFFAGMDAANIDLKAFTDSFYQRQCGGKLDPVLDTLRYVSRETDVWLEITALLIPGLNDSDDEIALMSDWIARELGPETPLHFTAFRPEYQLAHLSGTPAARCQRARELAMREGLIYVYTGNIVDSSGQTTYCPGCSESVIRRSGYNIGQLAVSGGLCDRCGQHIPGRFESIPPTRRWGSRRMPVCIGK